MLFSVTAKVASRLFICMLTAESINAQTPEKLQRIEKSAKDIAEKDKDFITDILKKSKNQMHASAPISVDKKDCASCRTHLESSQNDNATYLTDQNKPIVFVSNSMPKESLKLLAMQAKAIGGILIIRGMVNNSMQQTANLVDEIKMPVEIEPRLFQTHQVVKVPVFLIPTKHGFVKLSGNTDLNFALEKAKKWADQK